MTSKSWNSERHVSLLLKSSSRASRGRIRSSSRVWSSSRIRGSDNCSFSMRICCKSLFSSCSNSFEALRRQLWPRSTWNGMEFCCCYYWWEGSFWLVLLKSELSSFFSSSAISVELMTTPAELCDSLTLFLRAEVRYFFSMLLEPLSWIASSNLIVSLSWSSLKHVLKIIVLLSLAEDVVVV